MGALALGLLLPGVASAQSPAGGAPWVTIDDLTDTLNASLTDGGAYIAPTNPATLAGTYANALSGASMGITNESFGILGKVDGHLEFVATGATVPGNGAAVTANFNIYGSPDDADPTHLSDTLQITFTGHTPTGGDPNNVSVDLHFVSDAPGATLSPLVSATSITETGTYQDMSALINTAVGINNFHLQFQSEVDVPEIDPASASAALACMATGVLMLRGRRRKAESA